MNIRPVASKEHVVQPQSNAATLKAKAVAAFNASKGEISPTPPKQTAQHPAALDQNNLAAEDLASLQVPSPNIQDEKTEDEDQGEISPMAPEATAVAPETPVSPAKDPALSRQFAQLARQEKALRAQKLQQDQAFKERETALAQRETDLASRQPDLSKYIPRDRLKADPLSVLAENELTYEQLTQQEIARQSVDPTILKMIRDQAEEIKALKQANEDGKKSAVDQQQVQYQAAIKQMTMDAKALIKSDPIAFEAISKTGTVKDVVKLIEDTYHKDGVILSVEEAAKEVEDYLVEENYKMATRIEKIKKRINQVAPSSPPAKSSPVAPTQKPGMKTLTNANSAARPTTARDRAIAAFKGEKF